MKIFSDSFVIDFESIANSPHVYKTAAQLQQEFQSDPALFIDRYIEEFSDFFRPIDLGIINDPMEEEIFGQDQPFQEENDEASFLSLLNMKTLYLDDLILMTQTDDKCFDLTQCQRERLFQDIDCIDLSGDAGTTLIIDAESVLDLTDDKNTLMILGDDGDAVVTKGDWRPRGMVELEGHHYVQYVQESLEALIKLIIHTRVMQRY